MSIRIRVDTREIHNYLSQVMTNLESLDDQAKYYLEEGMKLAEGLAQVYVAVDTGRLRDSIHLVDEGDGISLVADAVDPDSGFGYAPKIETEQPFMMPAVLEALPLLTTEFLEQIKSMFVKDRFVRRSQLVAVNRDIATGRFVRQ